MNGHLYVAEFNEAPVGFCIWTNHTRVREITVHQCAMLDHARLRGIARAMINALAAMNPTSALWCKVRVDLPANYFWEAIGFAKVRTVAHKSSKQELNQYFKRAIQ
jgi:predicted GNAT superfamily acetyltransferase